MTQSIPDIAYVVNFVLLLGLLVFLLKKPVTSFLQTRSKKIEDNIRESENLRAEAMDMLSQYKKKISSLDGEVEALLLKAKKDGESQKEKILARAEIMASQIVENAKRSAQRESEYMRSKIEKQFMQEALKQAKAEIVKKASPSEHQAFVDHFVSTLGEQHGIKS